MATRIAVLGTGRMGSALVRRLAAAGFHLTLWDRTAERAKALGVGRVAATPADAVAQICSVSDGASEGRRTMAYPFRWRQNYREGQRRVAGKRRIEVGLAIAIGVGVLGCGSSLSDAQTVWCSTHDMTDIHDGTFLSGPGDDTLLQAADQLGIPVPASIKLANEMFIAYNASGNTDLLVNLPKGLLEERAAWAKTSDYAKACIAAFDAR